MRTQMYTKSSSPGFFFPRSLKASLAPEYVCVQPGVALCIVHGHVAAPASPPVSEALDVRFRRQSGAPCSGASFS